MSRVINGIEFPTDTEPCTCAEALRAHFKAKDNIDVDVHEWHMFMPHNPKYEPFSMHCPHGTRWFAEPTIEQRMVWDRRPTPATP